MESIVSLVLLCVFLLATTVIIQVSLVMINKSIQSRQSAQDIINSVIKGEYTQCDFTKIHFSSPELDISAEHDVILNKDDRIIAFIPKED